MFNVEMRSFGSYLKANRQEFGISASKLATIIGVSRAEISRIESGDRKEPSLKILRSCTMLFGDDMTKVTDMLLEGKPAIAKLKKESK